MADALSDDFVNDIEERAALITVVVVPRDTFSLSVASLENVLASLPRAVAVVVVDGASPPPVRAGLRELARRRPLTLITANRYLYPNEARNIGQRWVRTKYTVFVDNNVFVEPGWWERLVQCAEETGAAAVGPLTIKSPGDVVHFAGGDNRLKRRPDGRNAHVYRANNDRAVRNDVEATLTRKQTELHEFHCVLVRSNVFEQIGPLDEGLRSLHEECDLALAITETGGTIWFEPRAVAVYAVPKRLSARDAPYWFLRWSNSWNAASIERFTEKWNIAADDGAQKAVERFGRNYRRLVVPWLHKLPGGMSVRARSQRAVFRCWARVYETAGFALSIAHRHRALSLDVNPPHTEIT